MNIKKLLCLICVVVATTSVMAQTQSLAELARLEKQRRARLRSSGVAVKVYTENNRSATPPDATIIEAVLLAEPARLPAPGGKKDKTPEELAAERQKEWSDKLKLAQDQIRELEGAIAQNERSLASMYNITPAKADLASRIETDKARVAELRQSLVALEDERRRAGMPRVR